MLKGDFRLRMPSIISFLKISNPILTLFEALIYFIFYLYAYDMIFKKFLHYVPHC